MKNISVHLLVDTLVVPISWLLWRKLQCAYENSYLYKIFTSVPLEIYPKVELLNHTLVLFLWTFFLLCIILPLRDWLNIPWMFKISTTLSIRIGNISYQGVQNGLRKNLNGFEKLHQSCLMSVWQMFRWVILRSFTIHGLSFLGNQWPS